MREPEPESWRIERGTEGPERSIESERELEKETAPETRIGIEIEI